MLNFEDEIKKFTPSPELDEVDDAIYKKDLRDVNDIVQELVNRYLRKREKAKEEQA